MKAHQYPMQMPCSRPFPCESGASTVCSSASSTKTKCSTLQPCGGQPWSCRGPHARTQAGQSARSRPGFASGPFAPGPDPYAPPTDLIHVVGTQKHCRQWRHHFHRARKHLHEQRVSLMALQPKTRQVGGRAHRFSDERTLGRSELAKAYIGALVRPTSARYRCAGAGSDGLGQHAIAIARHDARNHLEAESDKG